MFYYMYVVLYYIMLRVVFYYSYDGFVFLYYIYDLCVVLQSYCITFMLRWACDIFFFYPRGSFLNGSVCSLRKSSQLEEAPKKPGVMLYPCPAVMWITVSTAQGFHGPDSKASGLSFTQITLMCPCHSQTAASSPVLQSDRRYLTRVTLAHVGWWPLRTWLYRSGS